jgi:hypothetical protein
MGSAILLALPMIVLKPVWSSRWCGFGPKGQAQMHWRLCCRAFDAKKAGIHGFATPAAVLRAW